MKDWAILIIRVAAAVVFIAHGLQKAFGLFGGSGIEGLSQMLAGMGFSPGIFWAYLVAYGELLGGIFILIGVFPRIASGVIFIIMAVAVFKVHFSGGFFSSNGGYEYPFVLMLMVLSLILSGAGKLSFWDKF